MEHKAKVVEMLSEAYMGTSTLKSGDLEAREDEVWPVIGSLLLSMSKWSNVKLQVSKGLVDMMGDSMFNLAINQMVKLHSGSFQFQPHFIQFLSNRFNLNFHFIITHVPHSQNIIG